MAHAIDQAGAVVGLLVHDLRDVGSHLVFVFPVGDVFLDFLLHGKNLMVRAAVFAALQRADSRSIRRIRVGVGRGKHTAGEGGVVAAAVLCMQAHHDVQHARFLGRELAVRAQHGKDGLRSGLAGHEAVHDHALVVEGRALGVVGQHHDAGQAGKQRNRGGDLVLEGAIFGALIVGVEHQNGTLQQVHDVARRRAHDLRGGEAVGQAAIGIEHFHELVQLGLRGQVAHKQQVGNLFKAAALVGVAVQQVVDAVTTESELALVGDLVALAHQVAMDVGDVGNARDDTRAVGIAQTALHGVALVELRVDRVHLGNVVVQGKLVIFHNGFLSTANNHSIPN